MSSPAAPVVFARKQELREHLASTSREGRAVVLVPTMGDLHQGHLSLVEEASRLGRVVVSVFVNPTQFGPGEDFQSYPRDRQSDLRALAPFDVEAVFAPEAAHVYGPDDSTRIQVGPVAEPMCGIWRPGHFEGVATVVAKLFNMVGPDAAVFGRKDAQQCLVIRRMVEDLCIPLRLAVAPTVRENDGLALSSRNRYLDADQRQRALALWRALVAGKRCLEAGERRREVVEAAMREEMATKVDLQYAEARTIPALHQLENLEGRVLLAVAAKLGQARLIDNLCLQVDGDAVREAPLMDDMDPHRVLDILQAERSSRGGQQHA